MIVNCVCKRKVPYMPQDEVLFTSEIFAESVEDAISFFVCEYGETEYHNLFGSEACEVSFYPQD